MTFRFVEPPSFSTLSTRYVKCRASVTQNDIAIDPTSGTIEFAFMADNMIPEEADWLDGSWETTSAEYLGRCLVGPDGIVSLTADEYDVWIRYTKSPETLIENIGNLVIY